MINKTSKIGVPVKKGFHEFMQVQNNSTDNRPTVTGFPVDVFNEVMAMLPYKVPYEFIQYNDNGDSPGYYDSLISQVYFKASLDVSLELYHWQISSNHKTFHSVQEFCSGLTHLHVIQLLVGPTVAKQ